MSRRNIYQGPDSCYAINEGVYVPGKGVNEQTAVSIAYLILRDLRRGWTYDHSCRRIPMTKELALKRLRYLYPLARKHYGVRVAKRVAKLLIEILYGMRVPERLLGMVKLTGRNAWRLLPRKVAVRVHRIKARIRRY